ncbi:MAG TPA: methyltransferase domain-containing protein [Candidatus Methylomirabilis sp.]|jgi:ubiquinone/menaquinone biosynthesis C-methylase UbiE
MNAFPPIPRLEGVVELLDRAGSSDAEVQGSLRDLERLNRHFGGVRTVLLHLRRMTAGTPRTPITILDVATGGADIPRAICRWARRRGLPVTIEALDRSAQAVAAATAWAVGYPEIRVRRAEAPPLPYPDRSFDVVISSLFLHHLTEAQGVRLLREMERIARRGLIVNDLRRSRTARAVTALATRLLSPNRLTRHDGPMSILRGFRPEELRRMAARAGLARASTRRHPWFRLALVADVVPLTRDVGLGTRDR